jgi:hypothetical protein
MVGGGVGFYLREELSCNIINPIPFVDSQFEYIAIETTICNKKYYLCNNYRAPQNPNGDSFRDSIETYNNRLDSLLSGLADPRHRIFIFSDCNINLLKLNTSQCTSEYLDTCHENGLLLSNFKATRIQNDTYSLIDHVMTNVTDSAISSGSIMIDISDHFPVFYCCNDLGLQKASNSRMSRSFTQACMTQFRDNLRGINWRHVTSNNDVDSALDEFLDTFHTLFDLHFPLRKLKLNRNFDKLNGFMTNGLMISRRKKNDLFKQQIRYPTRENVESFRCYRNIYNSLLRKSKKLFYEERIIKLKSKPKKLWDVLKKVSGMQTDSVNISEISDGTYITKDEKSMAEIFNNHFSSVGRLIQDSVIPTETDPLSYIPNIPNIPAFEILGLGPVHILDVIKSMPSKSSSDINNVSMKLIKFVQYEICVPLAHIFRLSIDSGVFPNKFKNTRVVPIFKSGSPLSPDNYRPIALVNSFS